MSCATGIDGAALVICNDYEFELIRQKTGLDEMAVLERAGALVITRGENGCSIIETSGRTDVPAVPPHTIVDPTGVGDAFRGGFMKGMGQEAAVRRLRPARNGGRDLRARAPGWPEPRLYLGGVRGALRGELWLPDGGSMT